jgi:hypothetical protein
VGFNTEIRSRDFLHHGDRGLQRAVKDNPGNKKLSELSTRLRNIHFVSRRSNVQLDAFSAVQSRVEEMHS